MVRTGSMIVAMKVEAVVMATESAARPPEIRIRLHQLEQKRPGWNVDLGRRADSAPMSALKSARLRTAKKGSVLAPKAFDTQGKGSVLAPKAVGAQGKGSVLPPVREAAARAGAEHQQRHPSYLRTPDPRWISVLREL